MRENPRRDFYEIQRDQKKKSLFLFLALILFYFIAVGIITLAVVLSLGFFTTNWSSSLISRLLLFDLLVSALVAFFHFQDARKFGARYILQRLEAQVPDEADRYHKQFVNTLEEIRIASGIPKVKAYVIPTLAINSMALVEGNGTPAVAVTEGLLAECTRDELQAVAAHEIAHVARGDAFYVTLVCSLANLFERLRSALVPDDPERQGDIRSVGNRTGGAPPLIFIAVTLSSLIMHLLSTLISREREILADASAVEFIRDPVPLARAVFKAHVMNSFVGDFSVSYSPIFIVPPDSRDINDGFFDRLFNSHPPIMKRIELLASLADKKPDEIIRQVWEFHQNREKARGVLRSYEETTTALNTDAANDAVEKFAGPTAVAAGILADFGKIPGEVDSQASKIWFARNPKNDWTGPMTAGELVSLPFFTFMTRVKNTQEGREAKAREFPQIRILLHKASRTKSIDPARLNKCPRCQISLSETFYEGVAVKICRKCRGKLVPMSLMERIIVRKEVTFSKDLIAKAMSFKDRFLSQPVKTKKICEAPSLQSLFCPDCGAPLTPRPYSYSYFLPVDKCLSCHTIWFDTDELEILQILIESRQLSSS